MNIVTKALIKSWLEEKSLAVLANGTHVGIAPGFWVSHSTWVRVHNDKMKKI